MLREAIAPIFGHASGLSAARSNPDMKEETMRLFLLTALAVTAFAATLAIDLTDANAVVCARGPHRAGCAGPNGAVVVTHPHCNWVIVNGLRVRRCV
jgi:hypothetical protein